MNKAWLDRLVEASGAVVDEAGNVGFGSKIAPGALSIEPVADYTTPVLAELSKLAVVDITGEDATEFFDAQVCNDLTSLGAQQSQINGYCSPKGRLLAVFSVIAMSDGYRVVIPVDVAPAFAKRLQMLSALPIEAPADTGGKITAMRAKVAQVKIKVRDDLVCSGIVLDVNSADISTDLPEAFPTLPNEVLGVSANPDVQIIRWHDDPGFEALQSARKRYLCIGSADKLFTLWSSDAFSHAAWPYWRWGDINAGTPSVFAGSSDQFIPQMVNMQLIDGLSFKKGCYPGQEIVARMQYLGKLKKHMKHLRIPDATQTPEPGATLITESNNNAGQIVDAVLDEQGLNLLAVVNIETPTDALELEGQGLVEALVPYPMSVPESSAS